MANSKMARFRLPVVKSWCDPRMASRIDCQIGMGLGSKSKLLVSMKTFVFLHEGA